jgi:hypothetical protein
VQLEFIQLLVELHALPRRARLINRAVSLCVVCALLIPAVIVGLFVSAFWAQDTLGIAAVLFTTALLGAHHRSALFLARGSACHSQPSHCAPVSECRDAWRRARLNLVPTGYLPQQNKTTPGGCIVLATSFQHMNHRDQRRIYCVLGHTENLPVSGLSRSRVFRSLRSGIRSYGKRLINV